MKMTHVNFSQVRAGRWFVSRMGWKFSEHTGRSFTLLRLQKSIYWEERVGTRYLSWACASTCMRCGSNCVLPAHQWLPRKPAKGVQSPDLRQVRAGVFQGIRVTIQPAEGAEPKEWRRLHRLLSCFWLFTRFVLLFLASFLIKALILWSLSLLILIQLCVACLLSRCNEKRFLKVCFLFLKLSICQSSCPIFNKRPKWPGCLYLFEKKKKAYLGIDLSSKSYSKNAWRSKRM